MKQIISNLRNGETLLMDVPAPSLEAGHVLIRTLRSLVSQGTERMLIQFGQASLLEKARSKPDKVRQMLQKVKAEGLLPTIEAVKRRLDEPLPLGYCNAGVIEAVGEGVSGFSVGDRVVSNGPHAEFVSIPVNLVAKVPAEVSDEAAAFTVLGAIGLQGVRLARPELGETFVVIGLGLVGQMVAQLLQANGCQVIGFDFSASKVEVARSFGITAVNAGGETDTVKRVLSLTGGAGADGVIITASTSSNIVISQAAHMSRKRGRIVLVGVVGLNLDRSDFYEKELTFQVSCSYGPGRYDSAYEEKGLDYPIGFVRWTENRNFQAVLGAMARGALKVEPLITRRVPLERYGDIYGDIDGDGLASLLVYSAPAVQQTETEVVDAAGARSERVGARSQAASDSTIRLNDRTFAPSDGALAIVGAGNFTKMTAMPALAAAQAPIKSIVSGGGVSGTSLGRKYGISLSSTDYAAVLNDPDVRGVIITTRHNLHAEQTIAALASGKHVLVEKPLCLTFDELRAIENAALAHASRPGNLVSAPPTVTVGFNRRFSPHVGQMKALLTECGGPISFVATMNVGPVPADHWVHDPKIGGGRLIGEACHYIDLAIFLTGSEVVTVSAKAVGSATDCASILLEHANGSTSVVNYLANGHRELSKERIEIHAGGRSLLLDNFCELRGFGFRRFSKLKTRLDKGHARQFALFAERVRAGGPPLIPWAEIANSARATLAIPLALAQGRTVALRDLG